MYEQRLGTVWRVGRYEITVKTGAFLRLISRKNESGWAAFDWACSLHLIDGQLCLQFQSGRGLLIDDEDITVRRLWPGSVGVQRALDDTDFELLDLSIADFSLIPELFQPLSAGVSDAGTSEIAVDVAIEVDGQVVGPVRGYFRPSECKVRVYREALRVTKGCDVTLCVDGEQEKFVVSWVSLNTGFARVKPHVEIWLRWP